MVTDASLLYIVIGVFSFIIGALGNKRNIGSIYAFLLSVTLTPFVGLVITLCTNKYSVKLPKKSKAIKVTGIVLMMVGMIIAITATMILKESSENYEYYDKGPMYTLINFGTGIFLLGLFNFENGRGKTFAKIPENEEDQGELRVFTITGQTEPLNPVEKENILIETTILENKARNKINLGQTRISIALLLDRKSVV